MSGRKDTDFVRISTVLRATLGSLSHADRMQKAVESAQSPQSLAAAFRSIMMQEISVSEGSSLEELGDAYLGYAIRLVQKNSPIPGMYDSLLYKFDAANLKLALKASLRGTDAPALFPYGTVSADEVLKCAGTRDFSPLPEGMAKGAERAAETYASSGDAMSVDIEIDRGTFEDFDRAAKRSGVPILSKIAALDADSANVTAFARIGEMALAPEAKRALFERAFVPGGEISADRFPRSEVSFDAMADALSGSYIGRAIRESADNDDRIRALERALSSKRASLCDGVKFIPFGGEVAAAYLIEREREVRTFALCAAYMRRGYDASAIRSLVGLVR